MGVLSHEIGYALGLGHVSGPNKLMYDNDGRTVFKPTSDEIDGVNYLYLRRGG
ncbi:matrixin family metalloprotease [Psychrobacillus sp. OK032]|uniref:matrixin family metalloprotease n=1 Tax=Psychrobacillus sp. OK032 TaxID=1884358 RepID=UPI0015A6252D|nr:matrixin family metalloprotease [Psychrobacillus sp. OK032]